MSGKEVVKRQETLADISVPVLFAADCRDEDGLDAFLGFGFTNET